MRGGYFYFSPGVPEKKFSKYPTIFIKKTLFLKIMLYLVGNYIPVGTQ